MRNEEFGIRNSEFGIIGAGKRSGDSERTARAWARYFGGAWHPHGQGDDRMGALKSEAPFWTSGTETESRRARRAREQTTRDQRTLW